MSSLKPGWSKTYKLLRQTCRGCGTAAKHGAALELLPVLLLHKGLSICCVGAARQIVDRWGMNKSCTKWQQQQQAATTKAAAAATKEGWLQVEKASS